MKDGMTREFTPNRWNWSQKDNKWVFIEVKDNGELNHHYQLKPPKEFTELAIKIKNLNEKLIICKNPKDNEKIFNKMMKISKKMQKMGKNC